MKCGSLTVIEGGYINGEFRSWSYPAIEFKFVAIRNRQGDKSPTHEVTAKNPYGAYVQIGAAWENKINRGERAGLSMFSISLDEPTLFEKPVKLSAFPSQPDGKAFALEYDREKPGAVEQGQTAQAA